MINLLIVDDESFTREGLIEMLPLKSLNITDVKQAFDGINALEVIESFKPDILLTDVKMPRMNGVDLAFEIRKKYPECSIIFMSGYSDKEYLKSAIQLKAISYVEKPIELDELQEAIKVAILENSKSKTISVDLEDKLAQTLTSSSDISKIETLLNVYNSKDLKDIIDKSYFLNILIHLEDFTVNSDIISNIKNVCKLFEINCFATKRSDNILAIIILFKNNTFTCSSTFTSLLESFREKLSLYCKYYICIGQKVDSVSSVYNSYIKVKECMKYRFFYDFNSLIFLPIENLSVYTVDSNFNSSFSKYLNDRDKQKLLSSIKKLTSNFRNNKCTPIAYIKDVYYSIILICKNHASKFNVSFKNELNNNILEHILDCSNIFCLENTTINFIQDLLEKLNQNDKKSNPINIILEYIQKNYYKSSLCLEDISKNTFLTPTYICVIFKSHTSKTINKYITEYRIEKAKIFLKDSNIKMSDVAQKVGYSDANYFSKIFRKQTSYTPSEYRRCFKDEI